jgi:hypothetical protein
MGRLVNEKLLTAVRKFTNSPTHHLPTYQFTN